MKKIIVTDMDNTLYDWVGYYAPSFLAMIDSLSEISGIGKEEIKSSFQRVHRKYHTSEYAFSIQELDVIRRQDVQLSEVEILRKYNPAILQFRKVRKQILRTFLNVESTLMSLREKGIKIFAFTDSVLFYALYRLKQLGIEHLFDGIVAIENHDVPRYMYLSGLLSDDKEHYKSSIPFQHELSYGRGKPNLDGLAVIMDYTGCNKDEMIVIGDSLYKDIRMAQQFGVMDIFAEYGVNRDPELYRELLKITHWTEDEIIEDREQRNTQVTPSLKVDCFERILDLVGE